MPTCKSCGRETNALHSGGDGQVPLPGLCADCHETAATVARAKAAKLRQQALAAALKEAGVN